MKEIAILSTPKKRLLTQAERTLLEQLPIDQKRLQRAAKLLEPQNVKRLGILAAGGAITLSLLSRLGSAQLYRAELSRELKKQLAPISRKLDELEAQNEALEQQNEALRRALESREETLPQRA